MKIGNDFKLPEKYETGFETIDIAGYKVIVDPDLGVLIQGIALTNLFECKVGYVSIMPLDEEFQRSINDFPFDVEEHRLIFSIAFNDRAWYFKEKSDAYTMLELILQVKEHGLHEKFLKEN